MNHLQSASTPQQQKLVMWVIWFAILSGIFMIANFAAPKASATEAEVPLNLGSISWIAIGAASIGMVIRWVILPRIHSLPAKLPAMIIGLALCEACGMLGMFAIPPSHADERTLLFTISVVCILLSAPIDLLSKRESSPFRES